MTAVIGLIGAGTAWAGPAGTSLPVRQVHILGRVSDANTGVGIAGMCVRAGLDGGGYSKPVASDSTGHYRLDLSQQPGSTKGYTVDARADCGANGWWHHTEDQTIFYLTATQGHATATGKNLSTTRAGRIIGTFSNVNTGSAVAGARVLAEPVSPGALVGDAMSGSDGSYVIGALDAATYYLHVTAPGYLDAYVHQTPDFDTATLFGVSVGASSTVNEKLLPTDSIAGKVTNPRTGLGIQDILVDVQPISGAWHTTGGAYTGHGGAFKVTGLGPGTYSVCFSDTHDPARFEPQCWHNKPFGYHGGTPLTVSGFGTTRTGVNQTLRPTNTFPPSLPGSDPSTTTVHITGTISATTTGAGLGGMCVNAWWPGSKYSGPEILATATTAANGDYQIDLSQEPASSRQYLVNTDANCGADGRWLDTWYSQELIVTATGDDTASGVDIAAPPATGRLVGQITDDVSGAPVSGACVLASAGYDGTDCATTGPDGRFALGVAAGDYRVEVNVYQSSCPCLSEWVHHQPLIDNAQVFNVSSGDTVVNETLLRTDTVTGTVSDAMTGKPLQGASVYFYGINGDWSRIGAVLTTDADGRWSIDGLGPGSYSVCFAGPKVSSGGAIAEPYARQCWQNKPYDYQGGDPVTVSGFNTTVDGVDASMVLSPSVDPGM